MWSASTASAATWAASLNYVDNEDNNDGDVFDVDNEDNNDVDNDNDNVIRFHCFRCHLSFLPDHNY